MLSDQPLTPALSPRPRGEGERGGVKPLAPRGGEREGPTAKPWEGEGQTV